MEQDIGDKVQLEVVNILSRLENRLHTTRMALIGTMKAVSLLSQNIDTNDLAYQEIKKSIQTALAALDESTNNEP